MPEKRELIFIDSEKMLDMARGVAKSGANRPKKPLVEKIFEGNLAIHNVFLCLFLRNTVLYNEIKTPKPLNLQGFGGKRGIPPA
jgi:hypothetical protein